MSETMIPQDRVSHYIDAGEFERYIRKICSEFLVVKPQEIDDTVLEVLIKAWRYRAQFNPTPTPQDDTQWKNAFRIWVAQIARRTCLDVLKRPGRTGVALEDVGDPPFNPWDELTDSEALRGCLQRLAEAEPEMYQAVVAKHIGQLQWDDFGADMGLTVSKARTLVQNGLKKLRQCLNG